MLPLAQMQAPQMPDLPAGPSLDHVRGPVKIPLFETWQISLMAGAGLIVFALLLWLLIAIIRTSKRTQATPAPEKTAILELEAARIETDDEQFAIRASHALRRFYEDSRGTPTLGRSTAEFLQSIRLPDNERSQLDYFLNTCDRAKFAKQQLNDATRIRLLDTARELITHNTGSTTQTGKEIHA